MTSTEGCGPAGDDMVSAFWSVIIAWLREEIVFVGRFDLRSREWSSADGSGLTFLYALLLFFLGRCRRGCELLETSLGFEFVGRKGRSFDVLSHVYNGDQEPSHRCRVTLSHFYGRLGRDLRQRRHWEAFVSGFHPHLFRVSGVRSDELLADPRRLKEFFDKLMELRAERTTAGVGGRQSDLIDSPAKVRKRQDAIQRQREEFHERIKPVQERTNRKLRELFPELPGLRI